MYTSICIFIHISVHLQVCVVIPSCRHPHDWRVQKKAWRGAGQGWVLPLSGAAFSVIVLRRPSSSPVVLAGGHAPMRLFGSKHVAAHGPRHGALTCLAAHGRSPQTRYRAVLGQLFRGPKRNNRETFRRPQKLSIPEFAAKAQDCPRSFAFAHARHP